MPDEMPTSNRRSLATYRLHLTLTSLTVTSAFALVIALAVFIPLAAHIGRQPIGSEVASGLAEHFLFLHAAMWPIIGLSMISCVVSASILFHRMRAPMIRFTRCFEEIERGSQPAPIVIRKLDYLQEEADSLNRMLAALVRRAESRRKAAERFDEIANDLSRAEIDPILLDELVGVVKGELLSPALSVSHGATRP